ncbi:MAG TPA: hypothetical protein VK110_08895 [Salinisphaeraceae bacterium]|nr:hypothetical protein [Salinisphaeraceae bacterium]
MAKPLLTIVFWIALIAFFAWDWAHSSTVDARHEPPAVALSSGQAPTGAHCASTY